MSPYKARASVLGIGVADIARTWGAINVSESEATSVFPFSLLSFEDGVYSCNELQQIGLATKC
jgi:hypothetical protein